MRFHVIEAGEEGKSRQSRLAWAVQWAGLERWKIVPAARLGTRAVPRLLRQRICHPLDSRFPATPALSLRAFSSRKGDELTLKAGCAQVSPLPNGTFRRRITVGATTACGYYGDKVQSRTRSLPRGGSPCVVTDCSTGPRLFRVQDRGRLVFMTRRSFTLDIGDGIKEAEPG